MVYLFVTIVSSTETGEPIEVPFGAWTWAGSGNCVLDGVTDTPNGKGHF